MPTVNASYEAVFIFSLKEGEEAVTANVEKFKSLIEKNSSAFEMDEWGKRRLAYDINYQSEGFYVLYKFTCVADFPAELERVSNITDGILRFMVVRSQG